ncbi:MAG: ABC transporter ATP-binding protein [Phycisphaerae bacterium]
MKTARGTLDLRQFAGTIWYFTGLLRPHGWVLSAALAATLVNILLSIAAPWPVQVVLDHVLLGKKPKPWMQAVVRKIEHAGRRGEANPAAPSPPAEYRKLTVVPLDGGRVALLWAACGSVVLIAVFSGLSDYGATLLEANTAQKIGNALRRRLFKHMQTLSLRFHERNRTGDLLLRLTGDISMVRDMLVESMFDLASAALLTVGLLAVMLRLSPLLTAVALAALPIVAGVSMVISIQLRSAVRKAREKEGDLISVAGEVLASIALVQAFTREEAEKERFSRLGRSSLRAGLRMVKLESRLARTVQIVTAVGTCGILYFGVHEVAGGRLTPGTLVVFMSYFNNLLKPVRSASKTAAKMAKASGCAERIRAVLATQPEVRDRPGAIEAPPIAGRVTFDDVSFAYGSTGWTVSDIRLEIPAGQRVALVGPTGAGKSTLIKLLLRFYDVGRGAVRIDGLDVRGLTLESLRRQVSVVPQETVLFGTTVGENIAMGRDGATLADAQAAARLLELDEWIRSLPEGYDTRVGERGVALSGGQRQLIALARALLRNGRILIFDEPTTGLDNATEQRVRVALRRAMAERTTLIISHRPRPLADVDRVVVVQAGRIVQDGPAESLLAESGLFRELFLPTEPGAGVLEGVR